MNVTVTEDLVGRFLKVAIWEQDPDGSALIWTPNGDRYRLEPHLQAPDEVLWRIPREAAALLAEALKERLGERTEAVVRRDFEREQARVDRLIDHLMGTRA